jgi:hypothetical protein
MPDYIPKPDNDFLAYGERVVTALEADEVAYGIVAADSLDLRTKLDAFRTALSTSETEKAQARTAVADKDTARDDFEGALRRLVQMIQVSAVVTDAARVAAGLPVRDTVRTVSAPIAPRDLVASADGSGVALLKWSANGNAAGVRFVVQQKVGTALAFSNADVVTATTFRVTGLAVGVRAEFRILARRGGVDSAPSNTAAVY